MYKSKVNLNELRHRSQARLRKERIVVFVIVAALLGAGLFSAFTANASNLGAVEIETAKECLAAIPVTGDTLIDEVIKTLVIVMERLSEYLVELL